jgi:sulfate transport system permease protein
MTSSNRFRRHILPGFRFTLGFTLFYLSVIVLLPFTALAVKTSEAGWDGFWRVLLDERVLAAFRLSFGLSALAASINIVLGLLIAWVLVRYAFPGRKILDAIVDLPFALPTAVAGIALTALYAPTGWLGRWFDKVGMKIAYAPAGIFVALLFISLPFVVRTVQPMIQDLPREIEEAAACLGANRWQTFMRVVLPTLLPALLAGSIMGFGRAVGEFGSVVFIAGNLPYKTEIVPLLIISKLEQYDYAGASALGFAMLLASFLIMLAINAVQFWQARFMLKS